MARIGKTFTFEAAHRLQNHDGKCRNLHGHSYRVEVQIQGPVQDPLLPRELYQTAGKPNPAGGMVLDFTDLKKWWKPLEAILDHSTILENTDPLFSGLIELGVNVTEFHVAPTAENLAAWLLSDLQNWLLAQLEFAGGFVTPTVRVWETENSWAES